MARHGHRDVDVDGERVADGLVDAERVRRVAEEVLPQLVPEQDDEGQRDDDAERAAPARPRPVLRHRLGERVEGLDPVRDHRRRFVHVGHSVRKGHRGQPLVERVRFDNRSNAVSNVACEHFGPGPTRSRRSFDALAMQDTDAKLMMLSSLRMRRLLLFVRRSHDGVSEILVDHSVGERDDLLDGLRASARVVAQLGLAGDLGQTASLKVSVVVRRVEAGAPATQEGKTFLGHGFELIPVSASL